MRPDLSTVEDQRTLKCHRCKRDLQLADYSMQGGPQADNFCNLCRIETSPYLFLRELADPPEWMQHPYRGCSPKALAEEGQDPDLFFPNTPQAISEARWRPLCGPCPVRAKCALYGSQTGSVGVWGGEYRGGLEVKGNVYQPGKTLVSRGRCKNGHKIASLDDVRIKRDGRGKVSGSCLRCYEDHNLSRRKTFVGAAA